MRAFFSLLLLIAAHTALAQSCYWKGNEYVPASEPVATYRLGNNTLAVAGWVEDDTVFSEFVLYECGKDTAIDIWWAVEPCLIERHNDTLYVKELALLPGADTLKWQPWLIHSYFNNNGEIKSLRRFETRHLFNATQIAKTLNNYDTIVVRQKLMAGDFEYLLTLATHLAIARLSGSKQAAIYFEQLKAIIQPDGAYAAWYNDLEGLISNYENK